MTIIQNPSIRVGKHMFSGHSICDGKCYECDKETRAFKNLKRTAKKYGSGVKTNIDLIGYACPVGLALSERAMILEKDLGNDTIYSKAHELGKISVDTEGNGRNPENIKKCMMKLGIAIIAQEEDSVTSLPEVLQSENRLTDLQRVILYDELL